MKHCVCLASAKFYTNIMTILIETTNIIFENNDEQVDISIMEMFKLTHLAILLHVKNQMSFEEQRYPQTYRVPVIVASKERSVVNCHCSVTRPVQFTLGTLPSTSNFTNKIGKNWTEKISNNSFHLVQQQKLTLMRIRKVKTKQMKGK